MIKFHYYATSNGECSSYKGVPIQLLSEFRKQFGSKYRIRYRGNRIKFKGLDGRTSTQCYQDCIKKRAEFFSAYAIDNKRKNMDNLTVIIGGVEYVRKDNQIKELERDLSLASHEDERKQLIINDLEEQVADFAAECHEKHNEISDLEERIEELEDILQSIRYECDRV
jgi:predicted RNase H-like nuclease (RuvC/YqgF family)